MALTIIGTATYDMKDYTLIYDDNGPLGPITWLNYINFGYREDWWLQQRYWAFMLNGEGGLTYKLNEEVTNWCGGNWRLPELCWDPLDTQCTQDNCSELLHVYKEMNDIAGGFPLEIQDFLTNINNNTFWFETRADDNDLAWWIKLPSGLQVASSKQESYNGLAVRPGKVTFRVPSPQNLKVKVS
jgi:hypothetical protein